jgi:hypothetical protein
MLAVASALNPEIDFAIGDVLALDAADHTWLGALAFYSLIHLSPSHIPIALCELARVLRQKAPFLLAFHVGDETRHIDEWWERPVSLDTYFFGVDWFSAQLAEAGFGVEDVTVRPPYVGHEVETQRAYIRAARFAPDKQRAVTGVAYCRLISQAKDTGPSSLLLARSTRRATPNLRWGCAKRHDAVPSAGAAPHRESRLGGPGREHDPRSSTRSHPLRQLVRDRFRPKPCVHASDRSPRRLEPHPAFAKPLSRRVGLSCWCFVCDHRRARRPSRFSQSDAVARGVSLAPPERAGGRHRLLLWCDGPDGVGKHALQCVRNRFLRHGLGPWRSRHRDRGGDHPRNPLCGGLHDKAAGDSRSASLS